MRTLLLISVLAFAAPDRPDLTPKDSRPPRDQVVGDWLYVGNGKVPNPVPAANPTYVFRILDAETIWITNGQEQPSNGLTAKITLDRTKNPILIDFMPRRGGNAMAGIVRVEGDRLTLAWSHDSNRPANFENTPNIHHFIRVKK